MPVPAGSGHSDRTYTTTEDPVEVVYHAPTGSHVTMAWLNPDMVPVYEGATVVESPIGSGNFPFTFHPNLPGTWTSIFAVDGEEPARYYIRASNVSGPPPLAGVGDVVAQFGQLTPAQQGLTSGLLRAASALIRSRFPGIDAQLRNGLLDPEVVALAVTAMVLRVLRNPRGLRSESTGPFSVSYDTTVAAGMLIIGPDELSILIPAPAGNVMTVGTIRVRPGLAPPPVGWQGYGRW